MDFSYTPVQIRSKPLTMDYFFVPWDTEIIGRPVAEINRFEINDFEAAKIHFACFEEWCDLKSIELCSCRIGHDCLVESLFLQEHDFRFIELNYHPVFNGLQRQQISGDAIEVAIAEEDDKEPLAQMAARIFQHGRFHQDISLGPVIGSERYKIWLVNSFSHPDQIVYKCLIDEEIVGFFVTEHSVNKHCDWVLVGLAPGFEGRGIGTRVWKAMMHFHQAEGMESIATSISSHNTAVLNLYVKLGFRFPKPQVTFHWHR
jgi:ribosomal protein S18 acetylase RimI-like enzyme